VDSFDANVFPHPASRASREALDEEDGPVPSDLGGLLTELQGGTVHELADAGLARLAEQRLLAIQRGAEIQAEESLYSMRSLSRLLALAAKHSEDDFSRDDVAAVAWHLHAMAHAMSTWQELARNASYFRTNREAAADIARRWAQAAVLAGEWPAG
jgi:hypothetical protein